MCISLSVTLSLGMLSCGGNPPKSTVAGKIEAEERWVTDKEWRFVSTERCATGPFEVVIPARDFEFARRVVMQVYGPRVIRMDTTLFYSNGKSATGWGWSVEGDHSRCRPNEGEAVVGAVVSDGEHREKTGDGKSELVANVTDKLDTEIKVSQLVNFSGKLPRTVQQGDGLAWFPLGYPSKYRIGASHYRHIETGNGKDSLRLRFWFAEPSDMEGVVFRFRDERLVPNIPIDRYRAQFKERVAAAGRPHEQHDRYINRQNANKKLKADLKKEVDAKRCASNPDHILCAPSYLSPPPLKKETRPKAPVIGNVDWLPGYWRYSREMADYLWIGGTYVVRAPKDPAPTVASVSKNIPYPSKRKPNRVQSQVVTSLDKSHAEQRYVPDRVLVPRPIPDRVLPLPHRRVEVIPAPPAIVGAFWVPGYWRLHSGQWRWVAGQWQRAPQNKSRFRRPSINLRGKVRVYIPGGWVLGL